jgi:hypothetical protein
MDENYLFETMGLTNATEDKLHEIFDKQLNQYLKTQMVITKSVKFTNNSNRSVD